MSELLLIPILLVTLYFFYRHIRKAVTKGGCAGNCAACSREVMEKVHGGKFRA